MDCLTVRTIARLRVKIVLDLELFTIPQLLDKLHGAIWKAYSWFLVIVHCETRRPSPYKIPTGRIQEVKILVESIRDDILLRG